MGHTRMPLGTDDGDAWNGVIIWSSNKNQILIIIKCDVL